MTTHFLPIDSLTAPRRWQFANPLRVVALDEGNRLVLHPPSGSWAIVAAEDLPTIAALCDAVDRGSVDEINVDEDNPTLSKLRESGLLLKDGRAVWSDLPLKHSEGPLNTLILKVVGYCNLACTYCYDYNRVTYRQRMSKAVAQQAISQALARAPGGLMILFHGGEPLLAFDLIRDLVPYARREAEAVGIDVQFAVQTNGTQFTPEVVDFLLHEDIAIGVSLDGPPKINDAQRIDHSGAGHQHKIEGALCEYPRLAARVGILTTVTRHNVAELLDVARYVRELGVPRWDITLFEATGRGADDPEQFKPDTDLLIASYMDLFDAVEAGEFDEIEMRPVLKYVRNALSYRRNCMCLRDGCGAAADLVSIRVDGTIEACDCIKDPNLELGRLETISIDAALASEPAHSIRGRSTDTLLACQTCDWRVMCGGTCQAKASLTTIDEQQCRLAMALFPEILRRLAHSDRLLKYARLFA